MEDIAPTFSETGPYPLHGESLSCTCFASLDGESYCIIVIAAPFPYVACNPKLHMFHQSGWRVPKLYSCSRCFASLDGEMLIGTDPSPVPTYVYRIF